MDIQAKDPAKTIPVIIGAVEGTCFVKNVKSSKHRLRMFPAYGIQQVEFEQLPILGVKTIVIHEDGLRSYRVSWKIWNEKGKVMDIGNGKQNFLSLKFMTMTEGV
jgi:hypothetical protein